MYKSSPSTYLLSFGWLVLLFLLLPSLLVIPVSLTDTEYLALPESALSFQYWQNTFTDPKWMGGLGQSLFIGFFAMVVATITGTLCAVGCWKLSSGPGEAIRILTLVPMIVPTIVYALGLYRTYTQFENFSHIEIFDTYVGAILAHAVIGMPFVVITVGAALSNMDRRLEQAARSLGASPRQILWRVILPNVRSGILSGAVFAFITSWDELVVVLFVASRKIQTLPRAIWSGIRESLDPSIAVIAVLLIVVTFIALVPTLISRRNTIQSH